MNKYFYLFYYEIQGYLQLVEESFNISRLYINNKHKLSYLLMLNTILKTPKRKLAANVTNRTHLYYCQ